MLLEKVIEHAKQQPEFDWDTYYSWLFSKYAGREVSSMSFWECTSCLTVNVLFLPARYGKCRGCGLIHLPTS